MVIGGIQGARRRTTVMGSTGKGRATAFAAAVVLLAVSSCGVIAE